MSTPIMHGAGPISIDGTRGGVLLLHGYTSTVQPLRDWALAFAQAGFAVEAPLLPGHGTTAEELATTGWSDYLSTAEALYKKLAARHEHVFVGGLCLGADLAGQLATMYPESISGLLVINGPFKSPKGGNRQIWRQMLDAGKHFFTWSTPPVYVENPEAPAVIAYNKVPIAPMATFLDACIELGHNLDKIRCPVLVFTSLLDSSASPEDSKPWIEEVSGPAEHIILEHSNHVATLDYDKALLESRSVEFALAITRGEIPQKKVA